MVHMGAAGLEVTQSDQEKFTLWARNALHMARITLQAVTPKLAADAYVAWLRPAASDPDRITFFLGDNTPADFASAHHPFSKGEGLAGSVWSEGKAAAHCPANPSAKWRPRADCPNASYVCVPVGKAGETGGVLGFGSDQGFDINPEQIAVMETFAAVLAVAVPAASGNSGGGDKGAGGVTPRSSGARSRARGRSTE